MNARHVYGLAAALTAIGLGLFLYKVMVIGLPLSLRAEADLWEVETALTFEARGEPVKLVFQVPQNSESFSIVNQSFVSHGYGVSTDERKGGNRHAVLSTRRAAGKQTVYYGFIILRAHLGVTETVEAEPVVVPPDFTDPERIAAEAIMQPALRLSADVPTFVVQVLKYLNDPRPLRPTVALLGTKPPVRKKVAVAARIMALAQLPARMVNGVTLGLDRAHARFDYWLEVHDGNRWLSFLHDASGPGLPDNKFAWWRGAAPFSTIAGGSPPRVTVSVNHLTNPTLQVVRLLGESARNPVLAWSLFNLPLQTQFVFRLLLVVPVGVFLLAILRNVVGVKTFGTFMPVLIALAFRETHLAWGIVLFTTVVAAGLLVRLYLEHLKLLLVPRLAAVLIVVILVMAGVSTLSHKLGIVSGLSVALFPMVIMTMTIERMSITWDEAGAAEAIREGIGSLVVAIFCYLVMSLEAIQHLFFAFPELLLIILAATVLLGRYSGYRLTEIVRFRVLGGDRP